MSAVIKKGWCPTLAHPMQTGDGLLVRLHIKYGIVSAENIRIIADCAKRYGNGILNLTSRGSLQIRGVKQEAYDALYAEISSHGFGEEARPERASHPDYTPLLGFLPTHDYFGTIGLGLAFGNTDVAGLEWLADTSKRYGSGSICLSPWRAVYLTHINGADAKAILQAAGEFIVDKYDARRAIYTCPGAPACSSAQGKTRELAMAMTSALPNLGASGKNIHVSGCAKGCACSHKTSAVITATIDGYDVAWNETAGAVAHASLSVADAFNIVSTTL